MNRKDKKQGGFSLKKWKKRRCYLAVSVLMAVLMAGCAGNKKTETKVQTTGELTMDSVIMRVGEAGITYREAVIYMYQMKERYEPGFGKDVWKFELTTEGTFGEYAKEEVIENLTQIKIIAQQAKKEKVELAEDEISEISQKAEDYLLGIKSEDIEKYNLTKELIESVYQDNRLAEKMFDFTTNIVDTNISDKEAKQSTIQYLVVLRKGMDRNGKSIKLKTKKEEKAALKRVQDLRKQAKTAADFGNFADANSDLEEYQITYGNSDLKNTDTNNTEDIRKKLPKEMLTQGLKMKTGEISKVLENDKGYYILYCLSDFDEDATREKKEEMIEKEQERVFSEAYTSWSKDYQVEIGQKLWEKISFEEL